MKSKFLLIAGFGILLSSCSKEELFTSDKIEDVHEQVLTTRKIIIPAEDVADGYLEMEIKSNDSDYLDEYIKRFENTTISLDAVDSKTQESISEAVSPYEIDNEILARQSKSDAEELILEINLNWDNTNFETSNGKDYAISIKGGNENKTLTLVTTFYNVSSVTSNAGYGAVSVYNNYSYWNLGCLCTVTNNTADWYFGSLANQSNSFYTRKMSKNTALEVRTFTPSVFDPGTSSTEYFNQNYGSFFYNSEQIWFNPRYNYSGTLAPLGLVDRNMIRSVYGRKTYTNNAINGNITVFIAG